MEVASPLTLGRSSGVPKRHFSMGMETTDDYMAQRSFKRRRFNMDVSMDGDSENNVNQATFPSNSSAQQQQEKTFFSSPNGQSSFKRCRTEAINTQLEVQRVVQTQAAEIESLKTEKSNIQSSLNSLRTEHERVVNENKILKKAVTIQQERQNQASSEIQAARQFKFDAEDRIKKLEQIILSLRYHLQAQQSNPANDFMGFPPRPPDVY